MHFVDYFNSTSFNRERDAMLQKCKADGMEGVVAGSDKRSRIFTGTRISLLFPLKSLLCTGG